MGGLIVPSWRVAAPSVRGSCGATVAWRYGADTSSFRGAAADRRIVVAGPGGGAGARETAVMASGASFLETSNKQSATCSIPRYYNGSTST